MKQLRDAQGLSVNMLAARVYPPTTGSQVSKLENGIVQMTEEWVRRLADALGVHRLDITEPAAKLTPREQALLDTVRGLSEDTQDTVFRVADGLARPKVRDAGD